MKFREEGSSEDERRNGKKGKGGQNMEHSRCSREEKETTDEVEYRGRKESYRV